MERSDEAAWKAALKVEEWAGEARVNLVRLVAVGLFYGYHLLDYHLIRSGQLTAEYHFAVTGIVIAWSAGGLALVIALARRWNPGYLKYAAICGDAVLITALLLLTDGPRSSLLVLPFLLVASGSLRLRLRLVWTATVLAALSYLFVCGYAFWWKPDWKVERSQEAIYLIGLVCAGLLAGQAVRQTRRFARDYGERFQPEPPA